MESSVTILALIIAKNKKATRGRGDDANNCAHAEGKRKISTSQLRFYLGTPEISLRVGSTKAVISLLRTERQARCLLITRIDEFHTACVAKFGIYD